MVCCIFRTLQTTTSGYFFSSYHNIEEKNYLRQKNSILAINFLHNILWFIKRYTTIYCVGMWGVSRGPAAIMARSRKLQVAVGPVLTPYA
jgi:hypothetical protein